ncbi:hypothetical protein I315_00468 [Cryptococcus gattii Ru294]|uniref:Uncharacterized protein n=2 Tax=Cryptococcus gattii TaxID=37769 RepID=E6R3W5_CRYGW|nr:Hypothetical Protein CGB_D4370W [Cryptococcus gattii WM276]KIR57303.1 hypothetical protein I315_00468 [Cryptococcus gattii Ru294]KIR80686.1 hypothetical protein I306_02141 [Cryptococcus gattii EJB2]KIY35544.1 hypothetical protein I305_01793 [Cryptococcus gattii E566]KJE04392.1 hypothetical protein I311_01874 [Cryptococcus gattii NT-10]ADV21766.1 Hypothetical Protein CGB_D4370W [Cryptococcus gattii WM276]
MPLSRSMWNDDRALTVELLAVSHLEKAPSDCPPPALSLELPLEACFADLSTQAQGQLERQTSDDSGFVQTHSPLSVPLFIVSSVLIILPPHPAIRLLGFSNSNVARVS